MLPILGIAFAAAAASFELPAPTGAARVGTTRWVVVDDRRAEPFEINARREIEVLAWYPTSASEGRTAPYLREGLAGVRSFGALLRNVNAFDDLNEVRAHALAEAPPVDGRLPLLIFSHGYTAPTDAYTALCEDLASHGFVVISVVHPYESSGSTLADGHFASMVDDGGRLRAPISAVMGEWADEDKVMAEVTKAGDRDEQRRLLRGYLRGLTLTSQALRRWADDIRSVVDRWPRGPQGTVVDRLRARVDLSRFGVLGHSMGGVASADFCLRDARCKAVLNLDGIPQYGAMIDQKLKRPMLMVYSARAGRLGASDAIYGESASPYYRADVADTLHLDFSDMVFWPALRERHATGSVEPARAVDVTRTLVREFFDQELRGRPSPVLAGDRRLTGVNARRMALVVRE